MKAEVESLISHIRNTDNPLIVANKISYFLSDALREGKISLYEAYVVNWEEIRFRRMGYTQPAWGGRVRIMTCLTLLNQKLLAHFFNDQLGVEKLRDWGLEANQLNNEKRPHYIMDRYNVFLDANDSTNLLEKLSDVRISYERLSDEDGPYHTEVFPYHYYSPEELLLGKSGQLENKEGINEGIEKLIIELSIK